MKLSFLGATGTVTGSRYLLEHEGARLLVDAGLFQGTKSLRLRNREPFPVDPEKLDAVVLTHAHIDHSGYLPLLVRMGFRGKIYCTPGTYELCRLLLPDSAHLQEEEARQANHGGYSKHHPALPLYTMRDAERALEQLEPVAFHERFAPTRGMVVRFIPSGHLIGAAMAELTYGSRRLLFSGDLGRPDDLILLPPEQVEQTDYLVLESTYGDRLHGDEDPQEVLAEVISRTVARGGVVVVPTFAVGRAQVLLYCLWQLKKEGRIPDVPVFLNSPMAISASKLMEQFAREHRLTPRQCRQVNDVAEYINSPEASEALNHRKGPMVILSASGMATGGRVLHHIKAFAPDRRNTLIFAGFQAEGTRGASIVNGAQEVKIYGEQVPIQAEVVHLHQLSAHADYSEILEFLSHFKRAPERTFITHGEPSAAVGLRERIKAGLGWSCECPDYLDSVELP